MAGSYYNNKRVTFATFPHVLLHYFCYLKMYIIIFLLCFTSHLPKIYQSFLMSATLTEDVQALKELLLHNPVMSYSKS